MSGYHYYEGKATNCYTYPNGAGSSSQYTTLDGSTNPDDCLPACMTRFNEGRSNRDQYDYMVYTLGMNLPPFQNYQKNINFPTNK